METASRASSNGAIDASLLSPNKNPFCVAADWIVSCAVSSRTACRVRLSAHYCFASIDVPVIEEYVWMRGP
jgi:hypothetical protein